MSNRVQELLALAQEAADVASVDMSEVSSGPARRILPEGWAFAQLIQYIELGKQPREFNGQEKPPALTFRLGFALFGEGYQNTDGTPYIFRTFDLTLGNNEKSKSKIAFDRMNYKGNAKHFAQLLGEKFLVEIVVKKAKTSGKERNEIKWETINPPFDVISKQPYQIPDASDELYQLFLWDVPTKETWDALFIEGTNDEGKSKNYLQEICLSATDFEGSALQELLGGSVPDHTQAEPEQPKVPEQPAPEPKTEAPATPATSVPQVPNIPKVPKA